MNNHDISRMVDAFVEIGKALRDLVREAQKFNHLKERQGR